MTDEREFYFTEDLTVLLMPLAGSPTQMEEEGGVLDSIRFLSGRCPDPSCQTQLYCPSSYQSIQCTGCGQIHQLASLQNVTEEKGDVYKALFAIKSLIAGCKPDPGTDNVKVHGLSNYLCKLVSPLLSHYGMDKNTGRAKLLTEMDQPEEFDCGVLCDRAFLIDPEHLDITGYGRDKSGSLLYLDDTLKVMRETNDYEDRLIPIHADGDGHCLVHAISRALVGRELFWHPLRLNLMRHLLKNLDRYKELLKNFVDVDEWMDIINECKPTFVPREGESVGLRNIHIFGLANVLKRPIILLDSLSGISSCGDYSGVFLPALLQPAQCKNKTGDLNHPLCIAWSSQGRNHFIPLVGIKGKDKPCPRLPRYMLQGIWGVHNSLLDQYIAFDSQGCCTIGGPRSLQESYIRRLVTAMEDVFHEKYGVHPTLVADVHQHIFQSSGFVGVTPDAIINKTHKWVTDRALLRCLECDSLQALRVEEKMLRKGGKLYELAVREIGELSSTKLYTFSDYDLCCRYNEQDDVLVPQVTCLFCKVEGKSRHMRGDGSVEYHDGDVTSVPSGPNTHCCGFKHFYNGKLYDHRPRELLVPLEWAGKSRVEPVRWWQDESDPLLNSNAYQIAQELVLRHFPGEFGIERLEQKIVSFIFLMTAVKEDKKEDACRTTMDSSPWNAEQASKIILSGKQTKAVHKEELTASQTERQLKDRISAKAPLQQAKAQLASPGANSPTSKASSAKKSRATSARPSPTASSTVASPPLPATPNHRPSTAPPKDRKIRLVGAGGRSETVTLTENLTFKKLQQVVFEALQVPPEHQKLRVGFPPKLLAAPVAGEEDNVVPLNHGDKISVENTAAEPQVAKTSLAQTQHSQSSPRRQIRGHVDSHMPREDALLNILSAKHSGGDGLDNSLLSLNIVAEAMGVDLWSLVQIHPHHFSRDGLFYRQAERDVGLVADKHFTFPSFPKKTFTYNALMDRLELCLGNIGHFEIGPNVEKKAMDNRGKCKEQHNPHHQTAGHHLSGTADVAGGATFGSSGAINKSQSSQKVFEGQGYSLRQPSAEEKMPEDVSLTENIQFAARRLRSLCETEDAGSSITEEQEMDVTEAKAVAKSNNADQSEESVQIPVKYTRKGPGFSVLEPSSSPPPADIPDAVQPSITPEDRAWHAGQTDTSNKEEVQSVDSDACAEVKPEPVTVDMQSADLTVSPEDVKPEVMETT